MLTTSPTRKPRTRAAEVAAGFTLIELILVMAMLLIVLSVTFPSLAGFFRGRNLDSEARRFLAMTRYAQSRAVSEGATMLLWIDARDGGYGVTALSGDANGADPKAVEFDLDPDLEIESSAPTVRPRFTATSGSLPSGSSRTATGRSGGNTPAIRFQPDGFIGDNSPERITIRRDERDRLWIEMSLDRLQYEIRQPQENERAR